MSRISKELAAQIATKLTEKSRIAAEELKKEYGQLAYEMYDAQTPKEVKDTFKKHPEWFYTRTRIDFSGHGFNYESVVCPNPVICNGGTNANLNLTAKLASQLTAASRKYEKAYDAYKQLKRETETAIINLGTHARIKENFPLAAPMLPPPMSNALVCNFDSLTKRLQKQPEVKKEKVTS